MANTPSPTPSPTNSGSAVDVNDKKEKNTIPPMQQLAKEMEKLAQDLSDLLTQGADTPKSANPSDSEDDEDKSKSSPESYFSGDDKKEKNTLPPMQQLAKEMEKLAQDLSDLLTQGADTTKSDNPSDSMQGEDGSYDQMAQQHNSQQSGANANQATEAVSENPELLAAAL
ncbi:MAG: hypothetical protein H0U75_12260 [Legionella sp.]|nr:hypothetical protein [Legionella sp.]